MDTWDEWYQQEKDTKQDSVEFDDEDTEQDPVGFHITDVIQ